MTDQQIPVAPLIQCNRIGCKSFAHGMLRLNLPAKNDPKHKHPPLQLPVELFLCTEHAKMAKATDFMTDAWRTQMRNVLVSRGAKVTPDFENAWVDLVPLEELAAAMKPQAEEHGHA